MAEAPRITQSTGALSAARLDQQDHVVLLLPRGVVDGDWPRMPYAQVLAARLGRLNEIKCSTPLPVVELPNQRGTRVISACLDDEASAFERLTLARKLAAAALATDPPNIAVTAPGLASAAAQAVEAMVAALLAAVAPMPSWKATRRPARLRTIRILGLDRRLNLARTRAEAEGNGLARYLAAMPANELTPGTYRKRVQALAKRHGWQMQFHDLDALKRKGAGAFLAVAQGSATRDAGMIRLRYRPKGGARKRPHVTLVGKGICFDTGGYSLKPSRGMLGMQADMEGSAVALGTLLALTRLGVDFPVDCWLALAENHIGPRAYKPTDVVTAANGVSIEVVNTDAEGRMVLADTLALAARDKPALILDYATLTGSCKVALGTRYSGAFTNRDDLISAILEAGRASGERVWPLPTDADYDEELDSEIADTKQCSLSGEADHTCAARLLNRFVPASIQWVHVDLSAGKRKGGLAHVPTEMTGFGVRFSLNLLLDQSARARTTQRS